MRSSDLKEGDKPYREGEGRAQARVDEKWPVPGHSEKTDLGGCLREGLEFNLEARGEVREDFKQRSYVISLFFPCVLPSRIL